MPNKKDFPTWFSINQRPYFRDWSPNKTIRKVITVDTVRIYDGDAVEFREGLVARIDISRCYDDVEVTVEYTKEEELPNPDYEIDLIRYNQQKAEHEIKLIEWEKEANRWKDIEEQENERGERAQLKKLMEKYGI